MYIIMNAMSTPPIPWMASWLAEISPGVCFLMAGRTYACSSRSGFCAFAIADLLCSEPESADAAAPTRRRAYGDSRYRLVIGKPGTNQFATTRRAQSLNHKLGAAPTKLMALRLKRMGLLDGKSRSVAIAVPFQTSRVIAFVLCVRQCLGFWSSQSCVVTRFLPVFACR